MNLGVPGGAHGCGREVNTKSDLQVLQWSLGRIGIGAGHSNEIRESASGGATRHTVMQQ